MWLIFSFLNLNNKNHLSGIDAVESSDTIEPEIKETSEEVTVCIQI